MEHFKLGVTTPDLDTFKSYAQDRRVIPVVRRLIGDSFTPVGLYKALANERPGTFLLESAEHGQSWSRYSFIGVSSSATFGDGRPACPCPKKSAACAPAPPPSATRASARARGAR